MMSLNGGGRLLSSTAGRIGTACGIAEQSTPCDGYTPKELPAFQELRLLESEKIHLKANRRVALNRLVSRNANPEVTASDIVSHRSKERLPVSAIKPVNS